jgi:hypothetical protein
MAKAAKAAQAEAETEQAEAHTEAHSGVETGGRRVRRVLMMKQFATPEWIMQNVVAKGKGTHILVGRIYGIASEARRKTNDVQGRPVESIAISGEFEGQSLLDGTIHNGATVYFPMAFAERIDAALKMEGVSVVNVDIDVGVEATGKAIPYEWTVVAHIQGEAQNALKALRDRRKVDIKQLAAPASA